MAQKLIVLNKITFFSISNKARTPEDLTRSLEIGSKRLESLALAGISSKDKVIEGLMVRIEKKYLKLMKGFDHE